MDFKESPFMYAIALFVVAFVISQSVFFLVKSLKKAKELGIPKETLKTTMVSSAVFTVAPAISILATVIVLANALGIVLPWIRLTVIGNLAYETTAAQTAVESMGGKDGFLKRIEDFNKMILERAGKNPLYEVA